MVGTRGKGKASAAKSKPKTPSVVSPAPEPIVAEESSEGPPDGEENEIEIPSTDEKENDDKKIEIPSTVTDEKENTDTTSRLVVSNGFKENQQRADEGNDSEKSNVEKNVVENNDDVKNDDEKDITNELIANEVDSLSGQTEETEEVNDGDDAANNVDSENEGVDTEENTEELSGGAGAVNNIDVENSEGKPDEEVAVEVKEHITDCGDDKNIHSGEENKDMEVAEDAKMDTGESLAASKHGVIDEEMMSKGASDNLNAEKPLSTSTNNEKTAEDREKVSISNNVEASAEKAKKPKRKLIRKKLIKKVPKSVVDSDNEVKPKASIVHDASGNANSAETKEYERNEEKAELKQPVTINRKLNRKRKSIVSGSNAVGAGSSDGQKAEPTINEQGTEMLKETDKLEVEDEKVKKSGNMASRLKKKRKRKVSNDETTGNVVAGDANKPGPSRKGKSKNVDATGMIFMCNSETKKDCYRYKVLGLPAGKKDFVLKIDKGTTLFLFDVDLKMLYGIYKAAAPGGFNIEPRAFKSKFPSQVCFTVLEDCVPLAEEKFKRVIQENYYTKNKFNCTLTSVQVGKLCALFRETTRKADSARIVRNPVEAAAPSSQRDRKRKRTIEGRKAGPTSSSKRETRPSEREVRDRRHSEREVRDRRHSEREVRDRRHSEREVRDRRHSEREVRQRPAVVDDRYYQRPVVYERDAHLPPPAPPVQVVYQALPPPQPSSFSYRGPTRDDIYRREPVPVIERRDLGLSSLRPPAEADRLEPIPVIEHRDLGLSSLRPPAEADRREPYASYKESRAAYLEPAYETGMRGDLHELSARRNLYELNERRDLYEASGRREHYDYTSGTRQVGYYATEYRPPLPPYRRY